MLAIPFIALAIALLWRAQGGGQPFEEVRSGRYTLAEGVYHEVPLAISFTHGMESVPDFVEVSVNSGGYRFEDRLRPPDFVPVMGTTTDWFVTSRDGSLAHQFSPSNALNAVAGLVPFVTETTSESFMVEFYQTDTPLILTNEATISWIAYQCSRHCVTEADRAGSDVDGETETAPSGDGLPPVVLSTLRPIQGVPIEARLGGFQNTPVDWLWELTDDGNTWAEIAVTDSVYSPSDDGSRVRATATFVTEGGETVSVVSLHTKPVLFTAFVDVRPVPLDIPVWPRVGERQDARLLTAEGSELPTDRYICCEWYAVEDEGDWTALETGESYTPRSVDVGKAIRVIGHQPNGLVLNTMDLTVKGVYHRTARGTVKGEHSRTGKSHPTVIVVPHGLSETPDMVNVTRRLPQRFDQIADERGILLFDSTSFLAGVSAVIDVSERHNAVVFNPTVEPGTYWVHSVDEDNFILIVDGASNIVNHFDWQAVVCDEYCEGSQLPVPYSNFPYVSLSTRYPVIGQRVFANIATSTGTFATESSSCRWRQGKTDSLGNTLWSVIQGENSCDSISVAIALDGVKLRLDYRTEPVDDALDDAGVLSFITLVQSLPTEPVRSERIRLSINENALDVGDQLGVSLRGTDDVTALSATSTPDVLLDSAEPDWIRVVEFHAVRTVGDAVALDDPSLIQEGVYLALAQFMRLEDRDDFIFDSTPLQRGEATTYTVQPGDAGSRLLVIYQYYVETEESTAELPIYEPRVLSFITQEVIGP